MKTRDGHEQPEGQIMQREVEMRRRDEGEGKVEGLVNKSEDDMEAWQKQKYQKNFPK